MKVMRLIGIGAALALASTAAFAFQEQQSGSGATTSAPAEASGLSAGDAKAVQVAPDATAPMASTGTEVRIPGLGKLGVLPKMDFGLELLYGAADRKPANEVPAQSGEELQIRGSLKHRF